MTEIKLYNFITLNKFEYEITEENKVILFIPSSEPITLVNFLEFINIPLTMELIDKKFAISMIPICKSFDIDWKNIFTEIEL